MKNIWRVLILSMASASATAQDSLADAPEPIIYKDHTVDQAPDFPGGMDNFYKYFARKFQKPAAQSLVDKVVLSFIVETDGTLTDIRIVHDAGFGTAEQAVAIVRQGPNWIPGTKDGQAVRVFHLLPIAMVTQE